MSEAARLAAVLDDMPYARRLGVGGHFEDGVLVAVLPFSPDLIGNPRLPALHGGAVGAFLELAAQMRLRFDREGLAAPATIGVTVEYLRPGRARETYARAEIKRLGRRIANLHVEAWQDQNRTPIALLQGRFLLPD